MLVKHRIFNQLLHYKQPNTLSTILQIKIIVTFGHFAKHYRRVLSPISTCKQRTRSLRLKPVDRNIEDLIG